MAQNADPRGHPQSDHDADKRRKVSTDSLFQARCVGLCDFRKIMYRSRVDGLLIPAYLFQPAPQRGERGHAAMIWVHGGVHGDWPPTMMPFLEEAVGRGYVIIAPEYRGSTGYGAEFYNAIDYGGRELDDVSSAFDYLATLPWVDTARVGIMGWSHGGYITSLLLFRRKHSLKAGAAIAPVSHLPFRLAYKGPDYARFFATQPAFRGLPHENAREYVERSPVYWVDGLTVPLLVHVATNDLDVDYAETQLLLAALSARKPALAQMMVYIAPLGAHSFNRLVDASSLRRSDTPEQRDSWSRIWTFFEWYLRPYDDRSRSVLPGL